MVFPTIFSFQARPKALAAALECAIQPMGSPEVNVVDLKGKSFGPKKGHDNLSSAGGEFMCEKKVVLLVEDNHVSLFHNFLSFSEDFCVSCMYLICRLTKKWPWPC